MDVVFLESCGKSLEIVIESILILSNWLFLLRECDEGNLKSSIRIASQSRDDGKDTCFKTSSYSRSHSQNESIAFVQLIFQVLSAVFFDLQIYLFPSAWCNTSQYSWSTKGKELRKLSSLLPPVVGLLLSIGICALFVVSRSLLRWKKLLFLKWFSTLFRFIITTQKQEKESSFRRMALNGRFSSSKNMLMIVNSYDQESIEMAHAKALQLFAHVSGIVNCEQQTHADFMENPHLEILPFRNYSSQVFVGRIDLYHSLSLYSLIFLCIARIYLHLI